MLWFCRRQKSSIIPKVMERLRRLRADISYNDSAHRFSKELGVDVFIGKGVFTSANTVEVSYFRCTRSEIVLESTSLIFGQTRREFGLQSTVHEINADWRGCALSS